MRLAAVVAIGVLVTVELPPPWALNAPLPVGSSTRMPTFAATAAPRATARARTGMGPELKMLLNARVWLNWTITST